MIRWRQPRELGVRSSGFDLSQEETCDKAFLTSRCEEVLTSGRSLVTSGKERALSCSAKLKSANLLWRRNFSAGHTVQLAISVSTQGLWSRSNFGSDYARGHHGAGAQPFGETSFRDAASTLRFDNAARAREGRLRTEPPSGDHTTGVIRCLSCRVESPCHAGWPFAWSAGRSLPLLDPKGATPT